MGAEERLILEMLREGKITVEDAERLLGAVRNGSVQDNRGFSSILEGNWWEDLERSLGETLSKVEQRISRAVTDIPRGGNIRVPLRGLKRKRQREEQGFTPVDVQDQSFSIPADAVMEIDIEGSSLTIEEAPGEARVSFDRKATIGSGPCSSWKTRMCSRSTPTRSGPACQTSLCACRRCVR